MNTKMEQLDKRNDAMRTLAVDLAYLRKTNTDLIVMVCLINRSIG